jgi:hypothetical protein
MQGFLRINTQIYEKNYGFQVDYRYHNRLSIFLFHISLSLGKAMQSTQACLEREVILAQIFDRTKLLDRKEGRNLNSFQHMAAFCISVERISGNDLCPIEDLNSKAFCLLFYTHVEGRASWG